MLYMDVDYQFSVVFTKPFVENLGAVFVTARVKL